MVKKIPLRNKNREIVDHALVDDHHYDHLIQFKWYMTHGYAKSNIENKNWSMHRYIKGILLKEDINNKKIDHFDCNEGDFSYDDELDT